MRSLYVILMVIATLLLVGCWQSSKPKYRIFSSTVKATYGGKAVEGTAILRQPLLNSSRGYTRGEATVIDLGNNKRAYMLLVDRGGLSRLYLNVLGNTFFNDEEYAKWPEGTDGYDIWASLSYYDPRLYPHRDTHLAKSLRAKFYAYPLLVAFENESDPTSIFLVDTEKPTRLFGKTFKFEGLYIAKVPDDTPLTNKIIEYLPWVSMRHVYWRDRAFSSLGYADMETLATEATLSQKVNRNAFFSDDRKY